MTRVRVKHTYRCARHASLADTLAANGAPESMVAKARSFPRGLAQSALAAPRIDGFDVASRNIDLVWTRRSSSRYSDGDYPVLYSATSASAALAESAYWAIELVLKHPDDPVSSIDYVMYRCALSGAGRSHMTDWRKTPMLVHSTDYSLCRDIGRTEFSKQTNYLVVPSARRMEGRCVPVLRKDAAECAPPIDRFMVRWDESRSQAYKEVPSGRSYIRIDKVYDLLTGAKS